MHLGLARLMVPQLDPLSVSISFMQVGPVARNDVSVHVNLEHVQ
jgi:hypothetical protein